MRQLFKERHAELDCSADQAWEYMSDLRRAMTLDQFHLAIDCDSTDALNPKPGLIVPILHQILGYDQVRLGRITKFSDYEIAWGESTPHGEFDTFPHSEGWKIEAIDSKSCHVTLWMKGQWRTPVGSRIQDHLWDIVIAPNLDRDIADLGEACGAKMSRPVEELPQEAGGLLSLAFAQEIDGVPAQEFFDRTPPLYPDKSAFTATWEWADQSN
ncbi:hypothetical protein OQ968_02200 [Mycobacterium sp. 663a-19]|uniref:hypothetical protein n=1 Tax=Mycobacterium sp. 663a-19 TaxID=2986148 RepID=UPI002D1E8FA5|nr:hypothetical protein [Mycobacterium sp. 663a-19]MEB3980069.1 hypothetical protein [Mycobacterium sp. 663a-19]